MSDPISEKPISQDAQTARGLTYQQVQSLFPEAWAALPECYQNDECLSFFLKGDQLQADHDLEPETYVWTEGTWVAHVAHKR